MKNRNDQFKLFFKGELAKYEVSEFVAWLTSAEGEEFMETEITKEWFKGSENNNAQWDSYATWKQVKAKAENQRFLSEAKNRTLISKHDSKKINRYWRFGEKSIYIRVSIAAAITLLVVGSMVFNMLSVPETVVATVSITTINKSTTAGQRLRFYLPDGTMVFLNAESTLEYTENFAEGRNVSLSGEGFFEVAHDSLRPFTVHAHGLNTTALGTSFNVKSFANEEETSVALLTGKVIIDDEKSKKSVFLTPGQQAKISKGQIGITKSAIENLEVLNWRKGVLFFKNNSLEEVVYDLERWYGVDITVKGEAGQLTFNGSFEDEKLQNVLELLSLSGGFNFKITKKSATIEFKKIRGLNP